MDVSFPILSPAQALGPTSWHIPIGIDDLASRQEEKRVEEARRGKSCPPKDDLFFQNQWVTRVIRGYFENRKI